MKINFKSRSWHTWASVVLALPILVVALTAIFIAHKKSLGSEEIRVAADWLPGYGKEVKKGGSVEPRVAFRGTDGQFLIGTLNGLFEQRDGQLLAIDALANTQVRGIAEAPWGRVVAAKNGIWLGAQGGWSRVHKGEVWSATASGDGRVIVAVKDQGLLQSRNGLEWTLDATAMAALAALPVSQVKETMNLHKLMMDLHTGKAFFGKDGEWIWIDLIGLALTLLGLTGLWMWTRTERRKRDAAATRGVA